MADDPLEPCPFCDEHAGRLTSQTLTTPRRYIVYCHACGAHGPWRNGPQTAIAAWNRRALEAK